MCRLSMSLTRIIVDHVFWSVGHFRFLCALFLQDGNTPLLLAVSKGFVEFVAKLLQGGADHSLMNKVRVLCCVLFK